MTVDEAKALVKSRLSEKRYKHTINVKKMAVKLAKRYGADEEKAALAALLHDSAKELPKAEILQIFADNAIIAKNAAKRPAPVWHGYAASVLCQTQWGVTDPEILSAIECHTTGKQNMSLLDKIIYMADMTSAERDYPGVEALRVEECRTWTWRCAMHWNKALPLCAKKATHWTPIPLPHWMMPARPAPDKGAGTAFCGCAVTE